eukprot:174077-Chlamydomonas_euryale.AAC.2
MTTPPLRRMYTRPCCTAPPARACRRSADSASRSSWRSRSESTSCKPRRGRCGRGRECVWGPTLSTTKLLGLAVQDNQLHTVRCCEGCGEGGKGVRHTFHTKAPSICGACQPSANCRSVMLSGGGRRGRRSSPSLRRANHTSRGHTRAG